MSTLDTTDQRTTYISEAIRDRRTLAGVLRNERNRLRDVFSTHEVGRKWTKRMINDLARDHASAVLRHDHGLYAQALYTLPVGTRQARERFARFVLEWTEDRANHQRVAQSMYCGDDDAYLDNVDHWRQVAIATLEYDGHTPGQIDAIIEGFAQD
jgi:hypothetical protein